MVPLLLVVCVVLDTTKVQIFKQITTVCCYKRSSYLLFQIPQRYRFSSKSQQVSEATSKQNCCFRYHKGTDFQANHNSLHGHKEFYHVVLDTTKVQIFKQITTFQSVLFMWLQLFQIPQRYRFSSKSQQSSATNAASTCCFRYHKGTDFQANHNYSVMYDQCYLVVLDTTKVQIFKQITTKKKLKTSRFTLFQIPQRYRFSSKSQQSAASTAASTCCFRYHKGTDFQANHNKPSQF